MNKKTIFRLFFIGLVLFIFIPHPVSLVHAVEENIVPADLGIDDVGTLPGSRLYFLKE